VFYKDTCEVYRVHELDRLEWLEYGFGTRLSSPWPPQPLVWVRQVHSARCVSVDGRAGCLGEADALMTDTPGSHLGIRTADCIPILLADARLRTVAAVHAGWRGAAQAIARQAVSAMHERFGSRPEDLIAAIGPGVCGQCYEVGPEVAELFRPWLPDLPGSEGRFLLDLAEANRRQLIEAGLEPARVIIGAPCTASNPTEFHSWRRDRIKTGRMVSTIAIRP
jgi:YfiH family protein